MTPSDITINVHFPTSHCDTTLRRIESLLQLILERQIPMTDFNKLQASLDDLKANVANVVIPLLQKVAQGSTDQPTVDALAAEAAAILTNLTGAEPAAPATPAAA